jgi:hypothetical protein
MKFVLAAARILRLYAIALWVGGLVFFIVVAGVSFSSLPSTHEAGIVVRGSLLALHTLGTYAGFLYLLLTIALLALGARHWHHGAEIALIVLMLALTGYSQLSIIPRMERDRTSLQQQFNTEVDQTPKDAPAHADFDSLHSQSTHVEGSVLLAGLIVLAIAAVSNKKD